METKINVAEILKNKPQGTKLYDWLHNLEVELDEVATTEIETVIWCTKKDEDYNLLFGYSRLATLRGWFDGLQILFPSKEMRDWSKFAWKKGDVLVGVGQRIIFEKFIDENYTRFQGKYSLSTYEDKMLVADKRCYTSNFRKLDDSGNVENYFKELEEELGGKLNRETLEVEKVQPEFKDGDIVCISGMGYLVYGIVKSIDYSSKKLEYYVLNDMSTLKFEDWLSFEDKQIQPITETQQIILFDALVKEGKRWDSEKKQIVDLKPKCEFKPFDKVLGRNEKDDVWEAELFSHYREESQYPFRCIGFSCRKYCIPYNEKTAHLLGTTDDWEGDEQ